MSENNSPLTIPPLPPPPEQKPKKRARVDGTNGHNPDLLQVCRHFAHPTPRAQILFKNMQQNTYLAFATQPCPISRRKNSLIPGASTKASGAAYPPAYAKLGTVVIAVGVSSNFPALEGGMRDAAKKTGELEPIGLTVESDARSGHGLSRFRRTRLLVNNAEYLEAFVRIAESDSDE